MPSHFILSNRLKVYLDGQVLQFKGSCIESNETNHCHLPVNSRVNVNVWEVESEFVGAWKNLNGLIVDVESVYVNGVHIDAVAEAALMIVKHECLAVEKVVGEDGDQ